MRLLQELEKCSEKENEIVHVVVLVKEMVIVRVIDYDLIFYV